MWNKAPSCIREVASKVLGVSRGNSGGHKGDWWWNGKSKAKWRRSAAGEWVECVDEEVAGLGKFIKATKTEAKLAATKAKAASNATWGQSAYDKSIGECTPEVLGGFRVPMIYIRGDKRHMCGGARLRVRTVGGDFGTFQLRWGCIRDPFLATFLFRLVMGELTAADSGGGPMVIGSGDIDDDVTHRMGLLG
ncbi:hypothetical protein H5410_058593 [Solanum commersonii]|uniref:Uncharacterized protein n=1 Tax=Solanum commersonii TaxID=4109 RepID=A0A9J5WRA0_SOLCO|nr:hypothetical protein H5410_058593 [Solanum commersonii]